MLFAGAWVSAAHQADKFAALGTAAGGSLAAGILVTLGALNLIEAKAAEKARHNQKLTAEERNQLLKERDEHIAEIRRLSSMRITANSASPELRLGVLKVPFSLTDINRRPVGKEYVEGLIIEDRHTFEYVGARVVRGMMHLGVDLQKVRVERRGQNELCVYGLECDVPSISQRETEHLFSEVIETKADAKNGAVKSRTLISHGDKESASRAQDAAIDQRLNVGADFTHLNHEVIGRSLVFIQTILAPLGVEVRLSSGPPPGTALPLTDFIYAENRALEGRIDDATMRLKSISENPILLIQ